MCDSEHTDGQGHCLVVNGLFIGALKHNRQKEITTKTGTNEQTYATGYFVNTIDEELTKPRDK